MSAEWRASNDDAAPIRCILMNDDAVVDVYVVDEALVDVEGLDVKLQLHGLDVQHTSDVLQ